MGLALKGLVLGCTFVAPILLLIQIGKRQDGVGSCKPFLAGAAPSLHVMGEELKQNKLKIRKRNF